MLFKSPTFSIVAVLTLALGIGANTTIFSLLDAVMLRSLPVQHPEQLVTLKTVRPEGRVNSNFSYPAFRDFRQFNQVFSGLIASYTTPLSLSGGSGPAERIYGTLASGDYFSVLGVNPVLGRTFTPAEDQTPGGSPVAVISYGLWQRRFGGSADVVGKTLSLNNHTFTIIGVAPASFGGMLRGFTADLWLPLMMHAQAIPDDPPDTLSNRGLIWLEVTGRLKPGVTFGVALASMDALGQQVAQANGRASSEKLTIEPGNKGSAWLVSELMLPLKVLMGAAAFLLLIACANVANLLLVRATARRREVAVKLAIGASRGRLIRQFLTESMLLALLGGGLGLLLAGWTNDLWLAIKPADFFFPVTLKTGIDVRLFTFALIVSVSAGVIFGLAPAFTASQVELTNALKPEGGVRTRERRFNLRSLLIVVQVGLSFVLLIGSGLFIQTVRHIQTIDVGFKPEHVLVATLDPSLHGYDRSRGWQFYTSLLDRVRAIPGVKSVTLAATVTPNLGGMVIQDTVEVAGRATRSDAIEIELNRVGPDYFATVGMPLLRGRDFTAQDRQGAPDVAVVNDTMARQLFPNEDPLGKRFRFGDEGPFTEIVGVVADGKYRSLREDPKPFLYTPFLNDYRPEMSLLVRSDLEPTNLVSALRNEVNVLDASLPLFHVRTLEEQVRNASAQERSAAILTSLFGIVALLLATVGIYGVISYSVTQRTHDIGIRIALGAQVSDVLKLVLKGGLALALAGVVFGTACAFALTRLIANLLFGVSATDATTFGIVAAILIFVTLLACYIPARKATKVNPLVALRYE